jgi:NTP pyrophosphatase (non-canonical NTP hydrolase)
MVDKEFGTQLNDAAKAVHELNKKWWVDINTGLPLKRNKGEQLMLMVSELSEAMEGDRKNLMDDKLPTRPMVEVELADCVIRILDFAYGHGLDLGGALMEKLECNIHRADHQIENRLKENGKKY